ncbi:MAG: hypothetical protein ACJ745_13235, partial [Actinomycetes bacterium]
MTQVHDDVNGPGDRWYAGRLDAQPEAEEWELDGHGAAAPADGEPLFEQLRSTYLQNDDSGEWARDTDTGGWASDDSGRWEAGT